jgi:hypothetical protein
MPRKAAPKAPQRPVDDDAPKTYFEAQRRANQREVETEITPQVPRQPASSPWHHDPVPAEPPLPPE